ncbi:MAG: MATE family efflux transporter [Weizmannia coagulans]|uniref:lipopolysaccharide biosynthesis protein n=1 Tax=Heyndrickxia coagulans TaxID=1398 RepID=UPI0014594DDA|nr:MATE family efflux transporter [Heyndrickxia coagulans]MCI1575003.1 MATE family efflux transporter [Heyndrickxia coagulans]NMH83997.1 MATE family efflux transporter [Heyndrickxia coagulans]
MLKAKKMLLNNNDTRTNLFIKNIYFNFLLKGFAFIVGLVMVRITYDFFKSDTLFGIWSTILTFLSWISMGDLGLGNGLRNELINELAKRNFSKGKLLVSTAYAIMFLLVLTFLTVLFLIYHFVNLNFLFHSGNNNVSVTILIVTTLSLINLFFNLIFSISDAYQKNYIFGFYNLAANIIIITFIFLLKNHFENNHLIIMALIYGISNILVAIIASINLYTKEFKHVKPDINFIDYKKGKKILKDGLGFFFLQFLTIIAFSFNNIVIVKFLGPKEVTQFQLAYKLFNIIIAFSGIIFSPLWSAYRDAFVRKDYAWMKKTIIKTNTSMIIFAVITVAFILFGNNILKIWINENIKVDIFVLSLTGVYSLLIVWQSINAYLLNSLNMIKVQVITFIIGLIIGVPVAIVLGKQIGTSGVLVGSIISLSLFSITAPLVIRKTINGFAE